MNVHSPSFMAAIYLKDEIPKELDLIQEEEGLGNRTATVTFLVKYYFLTKKNNLDQTVGLMEKLLDKLDVNKLGSAREQLSDV